MEFCLFDFICCISLGSLDFFGKGDNLNVLFVVVWDMVVFKEIELYKVIKMKVYNSLVIK